MRICVLADVHGNLESLRAAMPAIVAERADAHLFLGDLCGYYYDQGGALELLRSLPALAAVRGNHDEMFLRIRAGDEALRAEYRGRYGLSMEHLLADGAAAEAVADWLAGLPLSWGSPRADAVAFHGSPWEPLDGYVHPDAPLDRFAECGASLVFLGHTHHPMVRAAGQKGERLVVNPGSLGQPRQGGWPTWAVLDTRAREVSLRPVRYDASALRARIREVGDDNVYLEAVLERMGGATGA